MYDADEMSVDIGNTDLNFDVGDIIEAADNVTGTTAVVCVQKKVVKLENGIETITLSTDQDKDVVLIVKEN